MKCWRHIWPGASAASLLILLGVVTITFCLIFILPADPVRQIAGPHRHARDRRLDPQGESASIARCPSNT